MINREGEKDRITSDYQKAVEVSDDDKVVMTGMLQLIRIGDEVGNVHAMFIEGGIEAYEALIRIDVLLGMIDMVRKEVKSRL